MVDGPPPLIAEEYEDQLALNMKKVKMDDPWELDRAGSFGGTLDVEDAMLLAAINASLQDAAGPDEMDADHYAPAARSQHDIDMRRQKILQARADKRRGLDESFQLALGNPKGKMRAQDFEALRHAVLSSDDDTDYEDDPTKPSPRADGAGPSRGY
jgi:hypothetical protein